MTRIIIPVILVVLSAFVVFAYATPEYRKMRGMQSVLASLDDTISKTADVKRLVGDLSGSLSRITVADEERAGIALPTSFDEVRFAEMISRIVSGGRVTLKGIDIEETGRDKESPDRASVSRPVRMPVLREARASVSFSGSYADLLRILADMEKSLTILDVDRITLSDTGAAGVYEYTVAIRSYWSDTI